MGTVRDAPEVVPDVAPAAAASSRVSRGGDAKASRRDAEPADQIAMTDAHMDAMSSANQPYPTTFSRVADHRAPSMRVKKR